MNTYLAIFGKPRYLGLVRVDDENFSADKPKWVVLKTFRGLEMGLLNGKITDEQLSRFRSDAPKFEDSNESVLQEAEFIREATVKDIEKYYSLKDESEKSLIYSRNALLKHKLNMKIADVEYTLDRKKFFCYFVAEQRIDFRVYVKDIAHVLKVRIEMRQIGNRDEARVVKGISSCGRPCCCSYFLHGFLPVSIKLVKEQRSALNPMKISGLCGRLMCCMAYEKDCYSELWAKLPGPGAKIKTEAGVYVLEGIELGREKVNIRFPNGRLVAVSISDFEDFKQTVLNGEEWGEDKELIEKKKAAAERIAAIRLRAERKKSEIKANAKPFIKPFKQDEQKPKGKSKNKHNKKQPNNSRPKKTKKAEKNPVPLN